MPLPTMRDRFDARIVAIALPDCGAGATRETMLTPLSTVEDHDLCVVHLPGFHAGSELTRQFRLRETTAKFRSAKS